jgi:hypothetical protein
MVCVIIEAIFMGNSEKIRCTALSFAALASCLILTAGCATFPDPGAPLDSKFPSFVPFNQEC